MNRGWGACVGAALSFGVWEAATRLAPEANVTRWTLGVSSVPMQVSQLAGALPPRAGVLDLSFYRVASPRLAMFTDGVVDLVARVPTDGQLFVSLGADAVGGPRQPVKLRAPGDPGGVPGGGIPAGGNGGAPTPGAGNTGGAAVPGPPAAGTGGGEIKPPERGVTLLIDRSAQGGIRGRKLTCTPAPAPAADHFTLHLEARNGVVDVSVDGKPVTRCTGAWPGGSLVLGSGVRRIQIESVNVTPQSVATFKDNFRRPWQAPAAGFASTVLGAGFGWFAGRRLRRAHLIALSPLLVLPLLDRFDQRGVLDALRMLEFPEALGPLLFAGVPAAIGLSLALGATAKTLVRSLVHGLFALPLAGIVLATGLAGAHPANMAAVILTAALGSPLAALAWVNTHPAPRRVAISYALTGFLLVGAEVALRISDLDAAWKTTPGWKRASTEFAELLEIRRYRTYPTEGFPVKPPPPDPALHRIVALGGSSTGGAFQMDDLDQFWPKRLGERLSGAGWEVVNQGVGGWNTLHIRLYVESQIDRLGASIFVLYVGHNDVLATSPVAYRELYAHYQAPSGAVSRVSGALNELRLYVGLKHALFALRGEGETVAVPVADARENIAAIITIAAQHGAHVLLMTEGLNPDPLPMRPYGEMLKQEAAATGNAYFDAAEALRATGDPELFLDDCHLSADGHQRLAGWALDALRSEGWVQ